MSQPNPSAQSATYPVAILIGPSGAGKTTVGQALSQTLGCEFRDTDQDVQALAGCSVAQIFIDCGEAKFRQLEAEAVAAALRTHRGVLGLGGGAIINEHTRELLQGMPVVFLDVSANQAIERIGLDGPRPLLLGQPRAQWSALMKKRQHLYSSCAQVRVDTTNLTVAQIVQQLCAQLGLTAAG